MNSLSRFIKSGRVDDRRLSFCFREMLSILVESSVSRLGSVANAMFRTELLRGAAQADELAYGSSAHLTIKILSVDSRLCLAEDDHDALHCHGLLIVLLLPVACMRRARESSDPPISIAHPVMAYYGVVRDGTYIYHHAYKHLMHSRALGALRRSRAVCPPRVHRAYHIYFSILRCECVDSCTISHRFNAWLTQTQTLPTWSAMCPSTLTNLILRATVGIVGVFCKRVVSCYYYAFAALIGWLIIQTKE
jgi:hypothetical protein